MVAPEIHMHCSSTISTQGIWPSKLWPIWDHSLIKPTLSVLHYFNNLFTHFFCQKEETAPLGLLVKNQPYFSSTKWKIKVKQQTPSDFSRTLVVFPSTSQEEDTMQPRHRVLPACPSTSCSFHLEPTFKSRAACKGNGCSQPQDISILRSRGCTGAVVITRCV